MAKGGLIAVAPERGGSWYAAAEFCRSASRNIGGEAGIRSRQIGFRVAMTL
jgi:formylglycine-generating enzyme required for sulfatase activity